MKYLIGFILGILAVMIFLSVIDWDKKCMTYYDKEGRNKEYMLCYY